MAVRRIACAETARCMPQRDSPPMTHGQTKLVATPGTEPVRRDSEPALVFRRPRNNNGPNTPGQKHSGECTRQRVAAPRPVVTSNTPPNGSIGFASGVSVANGGRQRTWRPARRPSCHATSQRMLHCCLSPNRPGRDSAGGSFLGGTDARRLEA